MEKKKSELYMRIKKAYEDDLKRIGVKGTYEEWLERDRKGWTSIGLESKLRKFGF